MKLFERVWVPMKFVGWKNEDIVLEDMNGQARSFPKALLKERDNGIFICPGGSSTDPFCNDTR